MLNPRHCEMTGVFCVWQAYENGQGQGLYLFDTHLSLILISDRKVIMRRVCRRFPLVLFPSLGCGRVWAPNCAKLASGMRQLGWGLRGVFRRCRKHMKIADLPPAMTGFGHQSFMFHCCPHRSFRCKSRRPLRHKPRRSFRNRLRRPFLHKPSRALSVIAGRDPQSSYASCVRAGRHR